MSIDIDDIYREADRERGGEILESWVRDFHFRFQIKHLLIATAVLAIVLTLNWHGLLGTTLVLLVMISVAGLYLYLQWQEKKQQDEANRRRQEMYARRRAHLGQPPHPLDGDEEVPESSAEPVATAPPPSDQVDEASKNAIVRRPFRFQFSLRELMAAMTAAALIFGLVYVLGSPSNAATLLGFIALFGLVIHALGFEPPEVVVLGWWLILVLYVLLSVVAVAWRGFG